MVQPVVLITGTGIRQTQDEILTLPLTSLVILGDFSHLLGLMFLLSKKRLTIAIYIKYYFQD